MKRGFSTDIQRATRVQLIVGYKQPGSVANGEAGTYEATIKRLRRSRPMPTDQSDTASCDVSSQRVEGAETCQCLADSGKQADYLKAYQAEGGLAVLSEAKKQERAWL